MQGPGKRTNFFRSHHPPHNLGNSTYIYLPPLLHIHIPKYPTLTHMHTYLSHSLTHIYLYTPLSHPYISVPLSLSLSLSLSHSLVFFSMMNLVSLTRAVNWKGWDGSNIWVIFEIIFWHFLTYIKCSSRLLLYDFLKPHTPSAVVLLLLLYFALWVVKLNLSSIPNYWSINKRINKLYHFECFKVDWLTTAKQLNFLL